ncbi:hypothetical protein QOZ80_8AG0619250 [Eleusine coracana subsp. coracana]|nr:hypothetical protein QOZ80_8AG0619250 [Eleusine coracana subsp. coracana]
MQSPGMAAEGLNRREEGSSTLRILVATDCHLGYLEKDEERRLDSFDTFEEICTLAVKNKVDLLLLGGDLFHENKPSCSTLVKTIEILRRFCINDRPVQFQVVSDHAISLQNRSGQVNYEDPNYNIGLPVFTIHGNHDDPTGIDNTSTIDILSSCNFLNYFGKMNLGTSGIGKISVSPILITKAETYVALYGLGNIRDGRLKQMLQEPPAVNWMLPESRDETPLSVWFNILVLHQNRTKASPDNSISEHLLPRFLDLVIWGHQHECLIDPQEVPGMGFHITQPGSTIATSLISAEAKPKHVLLLEIKERQYKPTKIPLQSVRPFMYAEVTLEDEVDVDPSDEACVHAHLHKVVANPQDMIALSRSGKGRRSMQEHADSEELGPSEIINEQTIEALIEESNLKMRILSVHELNCALHEFVDVDGKMAFHSYLQAQGKETISKGRSSSQNHVTDTLNTFKELKSSSIDEARALDDSDDDIVECSMTDRKGEAEVAKAWPGGSW